MKNHVKDIVQNFLVKVIMDKEPLCKIFESSKILLFPSYACI